MCDGQGREAVMKMSDRGVSINELLSLAGDRRRKTWETYQLPRGGSGGHHDESTLSRLVDCPGAVFQGSAGPAASLRVCIRNWIEGRGELCSSVVVWQKAAEKKLLARARLL